MKLFRFLFVLVLSVISLNAFAQEDAITRFFDKYVEDEKFTAVFISPKVFDMIATMESDDPEAYEMQKVLSDLDGIRILTTEENGQKYYDEVLKTLQLNKYEVLMQVRDKGENVRFLVKEKDSTVSELLLLVGGSNEFVLMSFTGKIDLKNISKLSKSLNIEGVEHLEELEQK